MAKHPKTLTVIESEALLKDLLDEHGTGNLKKKAIRNYCIALLMLDAGMRVGEVTNLLQSDLILGGTPVHSVCIRAEITKTKTERIVPLSKRLKIALETMANEWYRISEEYQGHFAFYTRRPESPMTTRQVERIIYQAGMKMVNRKVTPHMLRHTFASRLMRTSSMRVVQELLGHQRITSTQIYTHPNGDDLRKAIDEME